MTKQIPNFDLAQTADSGQCFRMLPCLPDSHSYSVISCGRYLKISQDGDCFTFHCDDRDLPFWEQYFDLKTDYGAMIASISPSDDYLKKAGSFGSGIRILCQDPWEMIITFLISQQKTIPSIRRLVESLCRQYGTPLDHPGYGTPLVHPGYSTSPDCAGLSAKPHTALEPYSFPSPEQLNQASLEDLLALKLGYRAKYIKRICEDACSGALDLAYLKSLDYANAMEYLQGFYGIGEKVANCICLFGLHHIDAFPVDTWIRKILLREYAPKSIHASSVPASRLCGCLVQENFACYEGFAGVLQQYMFYYERGRK